MNINLNRKIKIPIYEQIKKQITDKIISGEWKKGFILPSERELSKILGVNRSTINRAYLDLKSEGLVSSQIGSGTVVNRQIEKTSSKYDYLVPEIDWPQHMVINSELKNNKIIKKILKNQSDEIISFAGGFVGDDSLPVRMLQKLSTDCFKKYTSKMIAPAEVYGISELRKEICIHMLDKGINSTLRECMILSGSQQGIDFFSRAFLNHGDIVFTESPTYIGAIQIFKSYGAKVIGIPIDEDGMNTDIMENYLNRYKPKFIYTIPTYQNPSGTTLSTKRRNKLLELAYSYQIPILEDDPYSDIGFENRIIPPLKALDSYDYVAYLSTFSKKFYMGGRIGWIICNNEILQKFGELKQITDLHANTVNQYFIYEALKNGLLREHMNLLISQVREKRDLMIEELLKKGIPEKSFSIPKGGFYIWLKIDEEINMNNFLARCKNEKVLVMPGDAFFPNTYGINQYIRLNYSSPSLKAIPEGVSRIVNSLNYSRKMNHIEEENKFSDNPIV